MKYLVVILISSLMLANSSVVLAEEFVVPEAPEAPTPPDYVDDGDGSSGTSPSNSGGSEPSNDGNSSSQAVDTPASTNDADSSVSSPVPTEPINPMEEPTAPEEPEPDEEPATDGQDIYLEGEESDTNTEDSAATPESESEGNPEIGADISNVIRMVVFVGGSIGAIAVMRRMGFIGKKG